MRFALVSTFCFVLGMLAAHSTPTVPHGPFRVGVGKVVPASGKKMAALQPTQPTSFSFDWTRFQVAHDGSGRWDLDYKSPAGSHIGPKTLSVDAACTKVVNDQNTTVYTPSGPNDFVCKHLANTVTVNNTLLAACANSGMCNFQ